jgi:hypothetical protein
MSYRVFSDRPSGRTGSSSTHETAADAFAQVVDLMTPGMVNVRIVDGAGREFTPTEFAKEIGGAQRVTTYPDDFDDDRR